MQGAAGSRYAFDGCVLSAPVRDFREINHLRICKGTVLAEHVAGATEQRSESSDQAGEVAPQGPFSVLGIRDYRLLILSNLATFAGFQIRNMAQAWNVLDKTGSETLMGLVNAMPGIAIISISLVGGALADRTERWQLMWRTKVIIASMALLTAVLLTMDALEWWHLIPISLMTGAMFAMHNPTSQAFAVDVVGRERLVAASSLNTGISYHCHNCRTRSWRCTAAAGIRYGVLCTCRALCVLGDHDFAGADKTNSSSKRQKYDVGYP